MTLLRIPTSVSAATDRLASYGNQIISSIRPSCWIQISTVDVVNIAADHQMFMTLTGKLSWQRLRRSAFDFYSKNKKSLFEPPFRGLRELHLWLVGKPMVDFIFIVIHCNWTFFAISYGWDVMSRYPPKSAFFEGGGSLRAQISEGRGHRPPTNVGVTKLEWLPYRVVSKYPQSII